MMEKRRRAPTIVEVRVKAEEIEERSGLMMRGGGANYSLC
jgi:hypothetical protein